MTLYCVNKELLTYLAESSISLYKSVGSLFLVIADGHHHTSFHKLLVQDVALIRIQGLGCFG